MKPLMDGSSSTTRMRWVFGACRAGSTGASGIYLHHAPETSESTSSFRVPDSFWEWAGFGVVTIYSNRRNVPEMFEARPIWPGLEQKGEGRREVILLVA